MFNHLTQNYDENYVVDDDDDDDDDDESGESDINLQGQQFL